MHKVGVLNRLRWHPRLSLMLALALTLVGIGAGTDGGDGHARFAMPRDPMFVKECGSCHTAYAPGLLTAAEWQRVMGDLQNHYGDDASLGEPARLGILRWVVDGAADGLEATRLMRRIAEAAKHSKTMPRITESGLFRYQHDEIPAYVWQRQSIWRKSNCGACHIRANAGFYDESEIKVPR